MLSKYHTKLSPRIIEHIMQRWGGKLSRDACWNRSDAKIYLLLEIVIKDMYKERYLNRKLKKCQK